MLEYAAFKKTPCLAAGPNVKEKKDSLKTTLSERYTYTLLGGTLLYTTFGVCSLGLEISAFVKSNFCFAAFPLI